METLQAYHPTPPSRFDRHCLIAFLRPRHRAEQTSAGLCADGDKIHAVLRVIVALQPNRPAVVFFRIVFHMIFKQSSTGSRTTSPARPAAATCPRCQQ